MDERLAISLVAMLALAIFLQTPKAAAQGSLGTVSVQGSQSCGNRGFDPANSNNTPPTPGMSCYAATLNGCSGVDNLQFVYGVEVLSGITPHGTIVFFPGDGGDEASDGANEISLIESYVDADYQVVQIAWGAGTLGSNGQDWEVTDTGGGTNAASILNAACRPATFLNWVRNGNSGVGGGIWGGNGGMCAEGHSAGSGALAYSLAWYNAGASTASWGAGYLDHAIFTSGPVFSDIEQGCEVNSSGQNNQSTTICQNTNQLGCKGWSGYLNAEYSLEYTSGYKSEVNQWTGATGPACANNSQQTTFNSQWFQQSILYDLGTQQPSFTYPKTSMSAWMCASVQSGVQVNNAAPEGQLFWAEFTDASTQGAQGSHGKRGRIVPWNRGRP
jgi:hypothetical protein